jgi:cell division protein FtsW (lipid II flippase)
LAGGEYNYLSPYSASWFILTYSFLSIGIIPALFIIGLGIAFIILLIIKYKKMAESTDKYIAGLILIYFTYNIIANILTVFGFGIYNSSHFPFLSYGRFTLIFDLCLTGILMRTTVN